MKLGLRTVVLGLAVGVPAMAATVAIDPVMKSLNSGRDPVPGRPAPFVFRGDNPILPPSINDSGQVVFRARSASNLDNNVGAAFGIYAKRPGFPLMVLVDTTADAGGNPAFPVPGRPANTRFGTFSPPLLNDSGNVLFHATFSIPGQSTGSGSGFYVTQVTGGPIVKITDTFTSVPGHPTAIFRTLTPGFSGVPIAAALNDAGQIVYWADFLIPPAVFPNVTNAIFGTTIAGGSGTLLADSTQAIAPVSVPVGPNGGFREIRPALAINAGGVIAFGGNLGPSPSFRGGVFAVGVNGGPITTVAFRGQPVPGRALNFTDTFEPGGNSIDINDSGVVIFRNNPTGAEFGHYAATPAGGGYTHTRILDTLGGIAIPGETVPPAEFSGNSPPKVNELGQVGVYSFVINSPTPNQQGFFATDTDGIPQSLVANLLTAPPGLASPPAKFSNFLQESAAINDLGNMSFRATGLVNVGVGLTGLYFYDVCTPELVRISDNTVSLAQLGGTFSAGDYDIWQVESASGQHRSINDGNDVAFRAQFNNFEYGIYVAHVTTGSGGQLNITCPADVVAQCPASSDPSQTGAATATGCGTITVTFADVTASGCGNTDTITRTWTASNGSTTASCVQAISEVDTDGPALSGVPGDAMVQCDSLPGAPTVTASDACQGAVGVVLSESQAAGTCPGSYVLTRTWTATDGCGNSTSASQDIAVMDTADPVLVGVPGDVAVECDAVPSPATVTASDTCDANIPVAFVETQTNGGCADEYTLTRSWTAADDCANDVTATQMVSVDDTVAPVITCPASATHECPGNAGVLANGTASVFDNCSIPVPSASDATVVGCGATYTVTRTWSAADECGNQSSCNQLISIVDSTPPVIALDGTPILVTDHDCSGFRCVALPAGSASDACDPHTPVSHNGPICSLPGEPPSDEEDDNDDEDDHGDDDGDDDDDDHHDDDDDDGGDHDGDGEHGDDDDDDDHDPPPSCNDYCFPTGTTRVTYSAADDCGNVGTAELPVTVLFGADIEIRATRHYVHSGTRPGSNKEPLVDFLVCAYSTVYGSCARTVCGGSSHHHYDCILENCAPVNCCTTDSTGRCTINAPPGDYVVISDDEDLPDALGAAASDLDCGEKMKKHLNQMVKSNGKKVPCKTTRLLGSELLIIEPEFIVWDEVDQLYPFVFESIGDWGVTVSVYPPEGFVADYPSLSEDVDNSLEAVQFTITEIGSDLVPTETHFDIVHKGERKSVRSSIGILLTPDYARSRGFDVEKLKTKGLIVEPGDRASRKAHGSRAGSR